MFTQNEGFPYYINKGRNVTAHFFPHVKIFL